MSNQALSSVPVTPSYQSQIVRKPYPLVHPEVFAEVNALLRDAVNEGVFPGCSCAIGLHGRLVFKGAFGQRAVMGHDKLGSESEHNRVTMDTVYDIGALTGVLATTTIIMKLVEQSKLSLTDPVTRFFTGFGVFGKSQITIAHLLSHSSGLVHWHPFYRELAKANAGKRLGIIASRGARDFVINEINRSRLHSPVGAVQLYSDVGLIMLGAIIELVTGLSLERAAYRYVFQPLGLRSTSYIDLSLLRRRGLQPVCDVIAPTEQCSWRGRTLCGEVCDENAWAMGGIAGHAGVFSTALDLHTFAAELLNAYDSQSEFLRGQTLRGFWGAEPFTAGSGWRLGWDSPSIDNGLIGCGLSRQSIGHNSFTGCAIWLEPERGLDIVLLSNRINPTRSNRRIVEFRPKLVNMIVETVDKLSF